MCMLSEQLTIENIEYETFDTNFSGQILPRKKSALTKPFARYLLQSEPGMMGRRVSYLTFVPSQTGCHMKNLLRRGALRNKHFSGVAHRGLGKVSGTPTCHGCSVLTNISRC